MFEDSTFESTGRIKTRSRRWMFATLTFNGSILVILILLPLIYPGALPAHMLTSLLVAPEAPRPEPRPEPVKLQPVRPHNFSEFDQGHLTAPPVIPRAPLAPAVPELPFTPDGLAAANGLGVPGGTGNGVFSGPPSTVVHKPSDLLIRGKSG
jgi:periplasmic protein TonB